MAPEHWHYSEALRRCQPTLGEEFTIRSEAEKLAMDMYMKEYITYADRQSVHETIRTREKVELLVTYLLKRNPGDTIKSVFEYLQERFTECNREDLSTLLSTTLEKVKRLSQPLEDDIATLTSKMMDASEMIQSLSKIAEYIESESRRNIRPSVDGKARKGSRASASSIDRDLMRKYSCVTEKEHSRLITACERCDVEMVTKLLDTAPECVNHSVNHKNETALMISCRNANVNVVRVLLKCEAIDVNARDVEGRTALMHGILSGDTGVIAALLASKDIDCNAVDNDGLKYEWYICGEDMVRHLAILMLLLKNALKIIDLSPDMELYFRKSIDNMIDIQNKLDWAKITKVVEFLLSKSGFNHTDLLKSCMATGNHDIVSVVLTSGKVHINNDVKDYAYAVTTSINPCILKVLVDFDIIDVKNVDVETIMESVIRTCPKCSAYMVKLVRGLKVNEALRSVLLMNSVKPDALSTFLDWNVFDLNIKDREGSSVFMLICKYGTYEMVNEILSRKGVDLYVRNKNKQSCFMLAIMNRQKKVAKLLWDHPDIDVATNDCDDLKLTSLMYGCMSGNADIVTSLLVHPNIDVNAKNVKGNTALIQESVRGMPFIYSLLDDEDTNYTDYLGQTDVTKMIEIMYSNQYYPSDHIQIVSLLLHADGIDVNVTNDGWTALMCACAAGNDIIVSKILKTQKVDINAVNVHGFSALMIACCYGTDTVAEKILKIDNVDLNITNSNGLTALLLASHRGHDKIVSLLLRSDVDIDAMDCYGNTAIHWARQNEHDDVVMRLENYQYQLNNHVDTSLNSL